MLKNKSPFTWFSLLSLCFLGFIIWIIYMANTGQNNIFFQFIKKIPYGDKLGHFSLFGFLTLAFNFGLNFKHIKSTKILLGTLLVFCFCYIEEGSQYWISTRTFDGLDLLADTLGILLFDFVSRIYLKYKLNKH